jgi:predicted MPP superfamily phosphohydrolase
MSRKRVLVISDLHSGHDLGLTHPSDDFDDGTAHYLVRRTIWEWYKPLVKRLKPHIVIVNGDAIDGDGKKSGGTEQITTDRLKQCKMAVKALKVIPGKPKFFMSYGTGYHTGDDEDFEDIIADKVDAVKIGAEDTVDVNGLLINYRHHIGRSGIPHGRHTAVAKEKLWNTLWAERGEYVKADIILRSHVHYLAYCGAPGWFAMTTGALQGYGSKYGARRVTGTVDVAMTHFDIWSKERWTWENHILRFPAAEALQA